MLVLPARPSPSSPKFMRHLVIARPASCVCSPRPPEQVPFHVDRPIHSRPRIVVLARPVVIYPAVQIVLFPPFPFRPWPPGLGNSKPSDHVLRPPPRILGAGTFPDCPPHPLCTAHPRAEPIAQALQRAHHRFRPISLSLCFAPFCFVAVPARPNCRSAIFACLDSDLSVAGASRDLFYQQPPRRVR